MGESRYLIAVGFGLDRLRMLLAPYLGLGVIVVTNLIAHKLRQLLTDIPGFADKFVVRSDLGPFSFFIKIRSAVTIIANPDVKLIFRVLHVHGGLHRLHSVLCGLGVVTNEHVHLRPVTAREGRVQVVQETRTASCGTPETEVKHSREDEVEKLGDNEEPVPGLRREIEKGEHAQIRHGGH